ncbi:sporulation histidine kinase inhibitor Sda [Lentibacillus amyloliquefaciens]|nr:sporulation histidine kinase inhibitor Sda [Lentibacillus amyloliquefaciens]
MEHLSNESLLEAYYQSKKLQLEEEFINIIKDELNKRSISFE